eukprot:c4868_g1_i1 orf=2-157(-)
MVMNTIGKTKGKGGLLSHRKKWFSEKKKMADPSLLMDGFPRLKQKDYNSHFA